MAADRSNSRRKISRILLIKGTLDIVGLILCKDLKGNNRTLFKSWLQSPPNTEQTHNVNPKILRSS